MWPQSVLGWSPLSSTPLACPVRQCHLALLREARSWTCPRHHSFDIARSGYVNLLQPQDRRSPDAGDARAAIEARAQLLAEGIGDEVFEAFLNRAERLLPDAPAVVVDLGCGSGDALGALRERRPITGVGIDLSSFAVDRAARRYPDVTWVVANADRRLPLLDDSVTLVLSLHARRNPGECQRVIATGGHLVVAVPAQDDLIELREAIQGSRVQRDRTNDVIAEHAAEFTVVDRGSARAQHHLDAGQLREVLRGTYRGERSSATGRVESLDSLTVTFASDFVVMRRR